MWLSASMMTRDDLGGRDRVAHEARRILVVRDDVDLLAAQLLHHRLDAGALHADAGADRIDVAVARATRRSSRGRPARARTPRCATMPLVDLGDLLLEQLLEQALVRARQDDLRAARVFVDVEDVGLDAVAGAVRLARHLLAHRQHRLGAAEVDDDVAALEAPDDAGDELALAVLVLVEDVLALGLADALEDDLLGGLRGDAAEPLAARA